MTIGELAGASGVPAKTIRYYEQIGLLHRPARADNGYRVYQARDVQTLTFIHRARKLGFPLDDVRDLLSLWTDRDRASADVKQLAIRHLQDLDRRVAELASIRTTLQDLVERCHGDHRPDCPILVELASPAFNSAANDQEE